MTKKMCLYTDPVTGKPCNRISDNSRCPEHRTNNSRGYGKEHKQSKAIAMKIAPYCWKCGCPAHICRLEWHHVEPLYGGRNPDTDDRRQLLCKKCHDSVKEK